MSKRKAIVFGLAIVSPRGRYSTTSTKKYELLLGYLDQGAEILSPPKEKSDRANFGTIAGSGQKKVTNFVTRDLRVAR